MRRLILEEPVTRAAVWSRRIGGFALAVTLIGVFLVRQQRVEMTAGLAVFGSGLLLALGAAGLAAIAFAMIWLEGRRGLGRAVQGLVLALAVLAWPGFLAFKAVLLPKLNDVSTDIEEPPAFSRSRAALAARGGHVPVEVAPATRRRQREAYPLVAPLHLDLTPEEAFEAVRKAAQVMGWEIVEAAPPGGRIGLGRLDAVDRSLILRFPDDITVRLRPRVGGTRIDVRSASRYGAHDFGVNAARITDFLEEVSAQAEAR
ncbi:DUF1499 domain-containing protein [Chelatococcus sp. SYSU_G07232]|uniref:DUF1499 domain-containing protein n=1 Tax=Chelatococcus albus TaxID=3047466 RepID=A0ABT7AED0_9HYPH|nr:DUF1499 domain-containing protein [Chelatococcus sp. SYSU_G07232]MDJ1157728.1 DUF1499 domain-containing protein [Chelatococcus sp. SYSU_G07232]